MASFFSRLSYSFGNEDWVSESKALHISSGDRVLCITASGDRPLHLLLDGSAEIVSVDLNLIQNHLLHLKIAAMENLEYEEYLAFLGATQSSCDRRSVLKRILPKMHSESAQYWLHNENMIQKGVLYQGAVEKLTKIISFCFKLVRKKKVEKLFEFDDVKEQKEYVIKEWESSICRKIFEIILNPKVSGRFFKDPGLQDHLGSSIKPGHYLYDRISHSMKNHLVKENLLLSLILLGNVRPEAFPPYLRKEGVEKIKPRLRQIKSRTEDVVSFLESEPANSYDAFSLSDVASYIGANEYHRLIHAIYRTAKPGARFSLRQFMSNRSIPKEMEDKFKRIPSLEQELGQEDRCFVYQFMVGMIQK